MPKYTAEILLWAVLSGSVFLNLQGNGFPLGYHVDELKKVSFIKHGTQDFMHPLLMLQLSRLAVGFLGEWDDQAIVEIGRCINGLAGVAIVVCIYGLTYREHGSALALIAAASAAVCPTLVVHAHYLKEDMLLTVWLLAALLCYLRFVERPGLVRSWLLGISCGMAFSSHYKSILLVPLLSVFFSIDSWKYWRESHARIRAFTDLSLLIAIAGLTAVFVFLTVNYPLIDDWQKFLNGVAFELQHARDGHAGVVVNAWRQGFTFHWRNNILPGMTPIMAILGTLGVGVTLWNWRKVSRQEQLLAAFVCLFYIVHETSPSKPPPDDGRYVLPAVSGLVYFANLFAAVCSSHFSRIVSNMARGALAMGLLWSAVDSCLLVSNLERDTRTELANWIESNIPPSALVFHARYASVAPENWSHSFDLDRIIREDYHFIAISSFHYERILTAAQWQGQAPTVYQQADRFNQLLQLPRREFKPMYRSFAFTNPTLLLIDLTPLRSKSQK